jgi:hypothetical protein
VEKSGPRQLSNLAAQQVRRQRSLQQICESRAICEARLGDTESPLVPSPFEGPIWAYHDFVDGPLEDVLFRIGSPAVRDAWPTPGERALYVPPQLVDYTRRLERAARPERL